MTKRSHLFGLVILTIFVGCIGASAQSLNRPEDVLSGYGELLKARNWSEAAKLMHPEALQRLRTLYSPLVASNLGDTGKYTFKVSSKEEFDRLTDIQIFERLMASSSDATHLYYPSAIISEASLIGSVKEADDLIHLVYRVHTKSKSLLAREMVVVSLKRYGADWRLLLSGNLEAMVMLESEIIKSMEKSTKPKSNQ